MTIWEGPSDESGNEVAALAQPSVAKLKIAAGASWPRSGEPFFTTGDVAYAIITGDADFGEWEGEATGHFQSKDVFWVAGGVTIGPIKNLNNDADLNLVMVTGGGLEALHPREGLAADPDNLYPLQDHLPFRRYRRGIDVKIQRSPFEHPEECENNGGVRNYTFPEIFGTPYVLGVMFSPGCSVSQHYHAQGAVYINTNGTFQIENDDHNGGKKFLETGHVRWVRPGWIYGPETTVSDDEVNLIVVGNQIAPHFTDENYIPNFIASKKVVATHVYG